FVPGSATVPTTGTVTGTHVYTTFGTFPVTVRVTDEGGAEGRATLMAVVNNLAPTLDPLPVGSFLPGGQFTLNATFNDAGLGDTHTVTIDWGDGQVSHVNPHSYYAAGGALLPVVVEPTATSPGRLTLGHVYPDVLDHTVTVTVTDNGGLSAQASRVYGARPV